VAGIGAVAGAVAARFAPWQLALLIGWNVATGLYVAAVWIVIARADGAETRRRSTVEDDRRALRRLLVVAAGLVSLLGAGAAVHQSGAAEVGAVESGLLVGFAVATVVVSWLSVNTDYTLRYAHLYYTPPEGGVDFQDSDEPSYTDFAYLAFTVGMTYQVADTGLLTVRFRRELLKHALVSYVFGAVIVAAMINIVAGLL
jgi:uncharacterized membrane protein